MDEAIKCLRGAWLSKKEVMLKTQEVLRVNSVNSSGDLVKLILREFS